MATWEPDEIDFEDQYDKADTIDDDSLDESINELNKSIREQEELQKKLSRTEWSLMDKDEMTKLGQRIAFNEKKQGLYIMRASKMILLILHRGFDKIKQDGRVKVIDQQSAGISYNKLRLVVTDEGTYKIAFENESCTYKDILSPTNRWLVPNAYLRIFGKKFMKDIGFDVDKPKTSTKSKIPKKRVELIERIIDEIDDNRKQFASELNKLPMNEDNQDNIMLQDIITKNEIATDNSIKLIETSLTGTGAEASTQTGGLTFRNMVKMARYSGMRAVKSIRMTYNNAHSTNEITREDEPIALGYMSSDWLNAMECEFFGDNTVEVYENVNSSDTFFEHNGGFLKPILKNIAHDYKANLASATSYIGNLTKDALPLKNSMQCTARERRRLVIGNSCPKSKIINPKFAVPIPDYVTRNPYCKVASGSFAKTVHAFIIKFAPANEVFYTETVGLNIEISAQISILSGIEISPKYSYYGKIPVYVQSAIKGGNIKHTVFANQHLESPNVVNNVFTGTVFIDHAEVI